MTSEANKAVVRRLFDEVLNRGNLELVDELFAPECVHHIGGRELRGPAAVKALFAGIRSALPDTQATIEDMIAEDDKVAVSFTIRGTHRGTLMDISATGRQVAYTGVDIFQLARGRIVKRRGEIDLLGLQRQLTS